MSQSFETRLQEHLLDSIPLARALDLRVVQASPTRVVLHAPLAPNENDKGCAFGGSIASLLTLASWSLLRVHTWLRGYSADIFVHKSELLYIAPIWVDIEVTATLSAEALQEFDTVFIDKGKAAVLPLAEAGNHAANGEWVCATRMSSRFVAIRAATANVSDSAHD